MVSQINFSFTQCILWFGALFEQFFEMVNLLARHLQPDDEQKNRSPLQIHSKDGKMLQPRRPCRLPLTVIIFHNSGRHTLARRQIPFMHCIRQFSSSWSTLAKQPNDEAPTAGRLVEIPNDIGYIGAIHLDTLH